MKRYCVKYDTKYIQELHPQLEDSKVEVYIDLHNFDSIYQIISDVKIKKKFDRALVIVLEGRYANDNYGKEEISERAKFITAIKFKGSDNIRLYCKEFFKEGKKVVIIEFAKKKTQKIDKKLVSRLESLGGYEYEFEQE